MLDIRANGGCWSWMVDDRGILTLESGMLRILDVVC